MATPSMYVGPAGHLGPPGQPQEKPGVRRALIDTILALDQARNELQKALQGPVIDTCGVFITRAGTQMGYARNNLLRASECLRTPLEMRAFTDYRRVPQTGFSPPRRF